MTATAGAHGNTEPGGGMNETSPLTDERAAEMLEQLTAHFGVPVMPLTRYCDALRTWAKCIIDRDGYDGSGLARAVSVVGLGIEKSSLLARLLYEGEPLRTKKCPVHDGTWCGINPCPHGCGETGWVPDNWPDAAPRCTRHPDRPAVSRTVSAHGTSDDCYECYRERWP